MSRGPLATVRPGALIRSAAGHLGVVRRWPADRPFTEEDGAEWVVTWLLLPELTGKETDTELHRVSGTDVLGYVRLTGPSMPEACPSCCRSAIDRGVAEAGEVCRGCSAPLVELGATHVWWDHEAVRYRLGGEAVFTARVVRGQVVGQSDPPEGFVVRVRRTDTSAATLARQRFEATGERTSPYRALPEREDYEGVEQYLLADGTGVERRRSEGRWAGTYAEPGPWGPLRAIVDARVLERLRADGRLVASLPKPAGGA